MLWSQLSQTCHTSHSHIIIWSQGKKIEGSGRNNIIYIIHVDLKVDIWSFRVG